MNNINFVNGMFTILLEFLFCVFIDKILMKDGVRLYNCRLKVNTFFYKLLNVNSGQVTRVITDSCVQHSSL